MKSFKKQNAGTIQLDEHDSLKRRFVGDIHFGEPGSEEEAFKKLMDEAKRENRKVILMGDLITAITTKDKRHEVDVHDKTFSEQQDFLHETFEKYGDIIELVLKGNHEEKLIKKQGDFLEKMSERYDINYGGYCVNILYEKHIEDEHKEQITPTFTAYYNHGSKSFNYRAGEEKRKETNKQIRLKDVLGNGIEADLYVQGHAHEGIMYTDPFKMKLVNKGEGKYEEEYIQTGEGKVYVCVPSLYRAHKGESYASRKGLKPTEIGCVDLEWEDNLDLKDVKLNVFNNEEVITTDSYAKRKVR